MSTPFQTVRELVAALGVSKDDRNVIAHLEERLAQRPDPPGRNDGSPSECEDGQIHCGCVVWTWLGAFVVLVGALGIVSWIRFVQRCTFGNLSVFVTVWLRNVFHRLPVQHVGEATVQPGFPGSSVVPTVDRLIEHVGVVTSEANDLLFQPRSSASH